MVRNGRKQLQIVANGHKSSKMIANCRKLSQMAKYDLKWSKMVAKVANVLKQLLLLVIAVLV